MPVIHRIYGIVIVINVRGEHPPPHVHAKYNEYEASVEIMTGKILEGNLPRTAQKLVKKWIINHRQELLAEWKRMEMGETPRFIQSKL